MKDILKEVDRLLFQIKAAGDDVFLMAQARSLLKKAYELAGSKEGDAND